jgi:hypothetical protein
MHINIQAALEKNPMKMYIKQLLNINNILETGTNINNILETGTNINNILETGTQGETHKY